MIKFITCLIGWVLVPIVMVVLAWDIAKCFVEDKCK